MMDVPSYPGASGMISRIRGMTSRVTRQNARYRSTRSEPSDFHANATYATHACASIQFTPNSISVKNRASPGRWIVMSRSRLGSCSPSLCTKLAASEGATRKLAVSVMVSKRVIGIVVLVLVTTARRVVVRR